MAKNSGPCYEFEMERNGADISYVFYPGNVSEHEFFQTVRTLTTLFKDTFGEHNDYLRPVKKTILTANGEDIQSTYKLKVIPSEMETLKIKKDKIGDAASIILSLRKVVK